jgi:hypothetical protein
MTPIDLRHNMSVLLLSISDLQLTRPEPRHLAQHNLPGRKQFRPRTGSKRSPHRYVHLSLPERARPCDLERDILL